MSGLVLYAIASILIHTSLAFRCAPGYAFYSDFTGGDYSGGVEMRRVVFDGTLQSTTGPGFMIVNNGYIVNRDISIDSVNGYVYWPYYDYEGPVFPIHRSNYDGSNTLNITVSINSIYGVYVDGRVGLMCLATSSGAYCTSIDNSNPSNGGINPESFNKVSKYGFKLDCEATYPNCYGYYISTFMYRVPVNHDGSSGGATQQVTLNTIQNPYQTAVSGNFVYYTDASSLYSVDISGSLPATATYVTATLNNDGRYPALSNAIGCTGVLMFRDSAGDLVAYDATTNQTTVFLQVGSENPLGAAVVARASIIAVSVWIFMIVMIVTLLNF